MWYVYIDNVLVGREKKFSKAKRKALRDYYAIYCLNEMYWTGYYTCFVTFNETDDAIKLELIKKSIDFNNQ